MRTVEQPRLAICSAGELFGGVERHILGLAEALARLEIEFFAMRSARPEPTAPVPTLRTRKPADRVRVTA